MELRDVSRALNAAIDAFSRVLIGREREIRAILLALVTKKHIYLLSPPGTGKTMTEKVSRMFGLSHMYYLFHYDTKLEDFVYNPIIRREKGVSGEKIIVEYELKKPGLGTVDVFFADEMFKAPTSVLNALLGAMNERRLVLGNREVRIPLSTVIAASNELPTSADALLDRFLFRAFLKYLPRERWAEYLAHYWRLHQPGRDWGLPSLGREVLDAAHRLLWQVDVFTVLNDYLDILERVIDKGITVSDRRKGRILEAIAASAVLRGDTVAGPEDLEVLLYTIPTNEEEFGTVATILDEHLGGMLRVKTELEKWVSMLENLRGRVRAMEPDELNRAYREIVVPARNYASTVRYPSLSRLTERVAELADEIEEEIVEALAHRILEEVVGP